MEIINKKDGSVFAQEGKDSWLLLEKGPIEASSLRRAGERLMGLASYMENKQVLEAKVIEAQANLDKLKNLVPTVSKQTPADTVVSVADDLSSPHYRPASQLNHKCV